MGDFDLALGYDEFTPNSQVHPPFIFTIGTHLLHVLHLLIWCVQVDSSDVLSTRNIP